MFIGYTKAVLKLLYSTHMENFYTADKKLIGWARTLSLPLARTALFVVYTWFGLLKVFGLSPATPLVEQLFLQTIPAIDFSTFIVLFGLFETAIGVLFLIKGAERVVILLLTLHLATTVLPLFLLPVVTWSGPFVPTLEGQYIIKNLLIIATALAVAAHLHPMKKGR